MDVTLSQNLPNSVILEVTMKNLLAEMARCRVSIKDIQYCLGCSEKTVRNKISEETDFTFPEVIKIRNTFFKGMTLEYLFSTEKQLGPDQASA